MNITRKLFVFPILSIFIFSCSKATLPLSLKERLHNAYLDVIEEDENDLRDLVCLNHEDNRVVWNSSNDKVLLFTLHRFPSFNFNPPNNPIFASHIEQFFLPNNPISNSPFHKYIISYDS